MIEDLKPIVQIVKQLEGTSSTKDKENILRANADNELLKKVLIYTYDDKKYGLQKKSIEIRFIGCSKWNSLFGMLDELSSSNINLLLKIEVANFLGLIEDEEERDLVIRILLKDLRVGISVKSINKAIKNLIPVHQVMLANKFEGKLKEEVSMSLKMDGIRNSALIDNGRIIHKSRQGKVVEGLNEINRAIEELDLEGYFIDGELIRKNIDNLPSDENFRLTTTIVNSKSNDKKNLEFVVFDITPIEDYYKGKCDLTYKERLELMEEKIGKGNEFIRLVDKFGTTKDVDEVYKKLDEVVSQNLEGLILNTLTGTYDFGKRPKSILKVKKFLTGDVLVTDIVEGDGRLKGTLGAVKAQFLYDGEIQEVEIGSGWSDSDRKAIFENPSMILNKIITISYFEISKNSKTGKYSLRFPTVKLGLDCIRADKQGIEDTNID